MQDADAAVIALLAHLDEFVRGSLEPGRHHPPVAVPHGAEAIPHQCIAPHRAGLSQCADGPLGLEFGDAPHPVLATVSRQLHGTAACGLAAPQAPRKLSGNAGVAPPCARPRRSGGIARRFSGVRRHWQGGPHRMDQIAWLCGKPARRYSRLAAERLYKRQSPSLEGTMAAAESSANPKHNVQAARQAYSDWISKYDMVPLWEKLRQLVGDEPKTQCAPAIWRFRDVKAMVMESADLISAKEAERRVLVLENPALRGQSRITQTLYAGLQLIMPGETAPAHRHTASAIRFIIDGEGAYTSGEGETTFMSPGHFVLTANWATHDHGNTTDRPMIWLDVLDLPTVNFFEAMFAEHLDEDSQPDRRADGDSVAFYASGVLPDGAPATPGRSPVVNYTYARTRPILERMRKA